MEQRHYVGLDVSQELTTVCVIDDAGTCVWRGTCASEPDAIAAAAFADRAVGYGDRETPGHLRAQIDAGPADDFAGLGIGAGDNQPSRTSVIRALVNFGAAPGGLRDARPSRPASL